MDGHDAESESSGIAAAWQRIGSQLPTGFTLGGVVYHGPDRAPGTEWIAFLLDGSGQVIGPEGAGADPVAALDDVLLEVRRRQKIGE